MYNVSCCYSNSDTIILLLASCKNIIVCQFCNFLSKANQLAANCIYKFLYMSALFLAVHQVTVRDQGV